jgi:hypothetical protein
MPWVTLTRARSAWDPAWWLWPPLSPSQQHAVQAAPRSPVAPFPHGPRHCSAALPPGLAAILAAAAYRRFAPVDRASTRVARVARQTPGNRRSWRPLPAQCDQIKNVEFLVGMLEQMCNIVQSTDIAEAEDRAMIADRPVVPFLAEAVGCPWGMGWLAASPSGTGPLGLHRLEQCPGLLHMVVHGQQVLAIRRERLETPGDHIAYALRDGKRHSGLGTVQGRACCFSTQQPHDFREKEGIPLGALLDGVEHCCSRRHSKGVLHTLRHRCCTESVQGGTVTARLARHFA